MVTVINSAVIIGAGNVACHLGRALRKVNIDIRQIAGRGEEHAVKLAEELKTDYILDINNITDTADLYIIAVSDDAIKEVINMLTPTEQLVVHTAGSIPMSVFENRFKNYGVFYPLQTFSRNRKINFDNIPICIEANSQINSDKLMQLAGLLSRKNLLINSGKRAALHLAAVFASNFTNHMYAIAYDILKNQNLDFSLLQPLITETASKIFEMEPRNAQTGPAVRNNISLMEFHLKMLQNDKLLQDLYKTLSNNIRRYAQ